MSTRGSNGAPLRGYVRSSRRRRNVPDLNVPPAESQDQDGALAHAGSQVARVGQQGGSVEPTAIDVEAVDDDVVISSPRSFEEAKNNSTRNRGRTIVVDVDSGQLTPSGRNLRRRVSSNQTIINCEQYVNLEGSNHSQRDNVPNVAPPSLPAPPKEPTFSCPVCMGPLKEEMSTKCGHIFCKACIKTAIATQGKCPTCRRKVTMKDTIRIYLPATS